MSGLTPRQQSLYAYRVDLYRKSAATAAFTDRSAPALTASSVPCLFVPGRLVEDGTAIGTGSKPESRYLDRFDFAVDVAIRPGDFIHLRAGPIDTNAMGGWWVVEGTPELFAIKSNRQRVLASPVNAPI